MQDILWILIELSIKSSLIKLVSSLQEILNKVALIKFCYSIKEYTQFSNYISGETQFSL